MSVPDHCLSFYFSSITDIQLDVRTHKRNTMVMRFMDLL